MYLCVCKEIRVVCGSCFAVYYSIEIEERQYKKLDAQGLCQASCQFVARTHLSESWKVKVQLENSMHFAAFWFLPGVGYINSWVDMLILLILLGACLIGE